MTHYIRCKCGELIVVEVDEDAEDGDEVAVFVGEHFEHLGNGEYFHILEAEGGDHSVN